MDKCQELSIALDAQPMFKKTYSDHVRDLVVVLHKTGKGAALDKR